MTRYKTEEIVSFLLLIPLFAALYVGAAAAYIVALLATGIILQLLVFREYKKEGNRKKYFISKVKTFSIALLLIIYLMIKHL